VSRLGRTPVLLSIVAVILVLVILQFSFMREYLDRLNVQRGALLQALIYAAQTVVLLYVLWISLRQLSALEASSRSAAVQSLFDAQRDIAKMAMANHDLLQELRGGQRSVSISVKTELFVDVLFNFAYNVFEQNRLGLTPPGLLNSVKVSMGNLFRYEVVARRWEDLKSRGVYPDSKFVCFMEELRRNFGKGVGGD